VFARQIGHAVDHDAGDALTRGGAHEAGLAVVDLKTLVERDGADVCLNCAGAARQHFATGACQVIGVSRVLHAELIGERLQAHIEIECA
jgi:hypothetical protein